MLYIDIYACTPQVLCILYTRMFTWASQLFTYISYTYRTSILSYTLAVYDNDIHIYFLLIND